METQLQFQQNASVVAADGRSVGQIERVVVNPETRDVTHIVVRGGSLFKKEERVLPIDLIAGTDESRITLRDDAGDLASLPPFEEKRLVGKEMEEPRESSPTVLPPSVYGPVLTGVSKEPAHTGEEFIVKTEQNIPEGSVALKEGAKVITAEGKQVGSVERVLADAPSDQATHLLVSTGMLNREKKLVPITWVSLMEEDEVHLQVEQDSLKELAGV